MEQPQATDPDARMGLWAATARLAPGLLLTIFGLSVLLTEYLHALLDLLPAPEYLHTFFARYSAGEPSFVAYTVLVGPVLEELVFRGGVLRALLALYRPRVAVPISAALFAVYHLNLYQLLPAFCMGLLFGWIYTRTRRLSLCVLGHVFWNAQWWVAADLLSSPIPGYGMDHRAGTFPQQPLWWLGLGVLALVMGVRMLRRGLQGGDCRVLA